MSNLFNHRREAYDLVDPLEDINDARNGILLYNGFHRSLEAGKIAFLKVRDYCRSCLFRATQASNRHPILP